MNDPLETYRSLAGHPPIRTTKRYVHLIHDAHGSRRKAADLANRLNPEIGPTKSDGDNRPGSPRESSPKSSSDDNSSLC